MSDEVQELRGYLAEWGVHPRLAAAAEAAYVQHGDGTVAAWFTRHLDPSLGVNAGWRFLHVLNKGVPVRYMFHFFADYQHAHHPSANHFGHQDVLDAYFGEVPLEYVRHSDVAEVKAFPGLVSALVERGVPAEYARRGIAARLESEDVFRYWSLGLPLEYAEALHADG